MLPETREALKEIGRMLWRWAWQWSLFFALLWAVFAVAIECSRMAERA